ncbi:hypothetical protein HPP92_009986 [Vanilla planifolia]|uniref:Uncharacterized protein n=1 Tax=Vanilla planifolia TaxID=51239 RepID=A0A835RH86_VANPL|nr:hypothetical protein HPP92_009986 [Vanilla planifolia]
MKAANTSTSGGRGSANHGRGRGSMATSGSAAHGLRYNQAKERSESGNMDKGNGKEQQGDTQQELAQTLVSLLRSIGGTNNQVTEASIDLPIRTSLGNTGRAAMLYVSRGLRDDIRARQWWRERKGSFSGSTSDSHRRRGGPSFSRGGGTSYADSEGSDLMNLVPDGLVLVTVGPTMWALWWMAWHMAGDCPKVSDIKLPIPQPKEAEGGEPW